MPRIVTAARRQHILDGDPDGGGGHRFGTGRPRKTEFPATWDGDKIIAEIVSVANDATSQTHVQSDGRKRVTGHRDGSDIVVIVERDDVEIVTGFPINVPPNP